MINVSKLMPGNQLIDMRMQTSEIFVFLKVIDGNFVTKKVGVTDSVVIFTAPELVHFAVLEA